MSTKTISRLLSRLAMITSSIVILGCQSAPAKISNSNALAPMAQTGEEPESELGEKLENLGSPAATMELPGDWSELASRTLIEEKIVADATRSSARPTIVRENRFSPRDHQNSSKEFSKAKPSRQLSYVVRKTDTLQKISTKFYGTTKAWMQLARANGLANPSRISAGSLLKIPEARSRNSELSRNESSGFITVTVKPGDTLMSIAEKALGSAYAWRYVFDNNRQILKSPNQLRVGQKLAIFRPSLASN